MKKHILWKLINIWPPFLGAGIRVKKIAKDFSYIEVEMKLRFWNKNYMSTHFGGSLFSMVDPFFMLMLIEKLGPDYVVWDKSARIHFKKPARGKVTAHFEIHNNHVDEIRMQAIENYKVEPLFNINIFDENGDIVAEVEKVLYVRHKEKNKADPKQ